MKKILAASAVALGAALGANAHAAIKIDGMPLMQTAPANGVPLLINGAGPVAMSGKRLAAAVYLAQNSTSASGIMTMPGAKSIRLTALAPMSGAEVAKALDAGIRKGVSSAEYAGFKPTLDAFGKQLAKAKIAKGQTVELLFEPANGIILMGPGDAILPAMGNADLFRAMLRMLPPGVVSSPAVQKQNVS